MRLGRYFKVRVKYAFVICTGMLLFSYWLDFYRGSGIGFRHLGFTGVKDALPKTKIYIAPKPTSSTGEALAKRIAAKCKGRQLNKAKFRFTVTSNEEKKILLCPICKLASTYWTRFFKLLERSKDSDIISPYDIPIAQAPPSKETLLFENGNETSKYLGYYRYMFVRDPYARLISAFVDKLFAPNPTFWNRMGRRIIGKYREKGSSKSRCGSDLKFSEYVKAVIDGHKDPSKSIDCHDAGFSSYCHPCEAKYDFVGKMETFVTDSDFIYHKIGMNKTSVYLKENGKSLADKDALIDTVTSPFRWKSQIIKCISWFEALKRIWRKLQIRGVIGKDEFPLDENKANEISPDELIQLIINTQKHTLYADRKLQRKEAMIEIFSEISISDMEALRHVYSEDFDLFEYDSKPFYLFNISSSLQKYGYLSVN